MIIKYKNKEHEGNIYKDGKKIFIRTELIFNHYEYGYNKYLAKLFNISCYMTKEYMNKIDLKYLFKSFQHINFITNEHDYFF